MAAKSESTKVAETKTLQKTEDGSPITMTLDEKLQEDASPKVSVDEIDAKAIKKDPAVPDSLTATTVTENMPGITDPLNRLDRKRNGPEALAHLKSGPHRSSVMIIDGTTVSTDGDGQPA